MKLIHLSFDIPDEFNSDKTVAIKKLIEASESLGNENFYYSLNRVNNKKHKTSIYKDDKHVTISKFGYPYGINLIKTLTMFYKEIVKNNENLNRYDIIHAHKLTYEGYIAYLISHKYNIPYVVSIRFTDFKIMKFRRDLIHIYKRVLLKSKKVFCVAPWMINELYRVFGADFINQIKEKIDILPNIIDSKSYECKVVNNNTFITVFKITNKNLKRKNIFRTLDAIKKINDKGRKIQLHIVGGGDGIEKLKKYIRRNNLTETVKLLGEIEHTQLMEQLREYKAFILCSYPETFGLVYIEALIKGLPIIYTKNAGIDGYFDEYLIGDKVNYRSVQSILDAILRVNDNINEYRNNVKIVQQDNILRMFSKEEVALRYSKAVGLVVKDK